jgi:hypothetical protein
MVRRTIVVLVWDFMATSLVERRGALRKYSQAFSTNCMVQPLVGLIWFGDAWPSDLILPTTSPPASIIILGGLGKTVNADDAVSSDLPPRNPSKNKILEFLEEKLCFRA